MESNNSQPRMLMRAEIHKRAGQLKEGRIGGFTIMCDEGTEKQVPSPLQYFFLSIGFCLLTQVTRNAEKLDIEIRSAAVRTQGRFGRTGSVDEGTQQNRVTNVDVELDIESDAAPEVIAELARRSEEMCYVAQAVKNPVEMTLAVRLNEAPLVEAPA